VGAGPEETGEDRDKGGAFMIRAFKAVCAICALVALTAIPRPAGAEVVDRIVAIINDSIITLSELNAASALEKQGISSKDDIARTDIAQYRSKILESLIEQRLVKQASDKAGIDVSEREIDNAIEDIKRQNSLSQDSLLIVLAQSGLTYRQYRDQLKEEIRQAKFINREFRSKIAISDEDVRDFYEKNIKEFLGAPSYRIGLIFIPSGKDAEKRLFAVQEGLKAKEDFSSLASQYSESPSASVGGDMGYLKSGEMDRPIEDAAKTLPIGGVSQPIRTQEGAYIIKLLDMTPASPLSLEEVKPRIQDRLFKKAMDERFSFWLEEAKKSSHIEKRL
jgi:peptidyl-prolyl cis-trans isomerase SurA